MKAVIFDMDGVIVDSEPYNLRQVLRYVHSVRPEVDEKELFQIVGRVKQDVWTRISSVMNQGKGWQETKNDYEVNWKPYHTFPVSYRDIFRKEIIQILEWAKSKGMSVAVASSTAYDKVREILVEVGVEPYLDLIVSGESFEKSKPDPEIYLRAAQLLGVAPKECVAIEDSTVGITAASRAGIKVIALNDDRFGFDQSLADGVIENLGRFIERYETMFELTGGDHEQS